MGEPIQGSDQHNPRVDEDLAQHPRVLDETADTELWDEPERDEIVSDSEADQDRTGLRSDIGKYASLATFPATGADLLGIAVREDADDDVLDRLGGLDPDEEFESPTQLWAALGLSTGHRE